MTNVEKVVSVTNTEASSYKFLLGFTGVVATIATVIFTVWSMQMNASIEGIRLEAGKANEALVGLVKEMAEIKTAQRFIEKDITTLKEDLKKLANDPKPK